MSAATGATVPAAALELREWLVSGALLAGAYLGARLLSALVTSSVGRAARRTPTAVDDLLLKALSRPLTYSLFLAGAYAAVHRLPLAPRTLRWLDDVLFVGGVLLLSAAVWRAWRIAMGWYGDPARPGATEGPAREFGPLFAKTGRVLIVLLAAIGVLHHFQVNVASLVVSLGVGSLAVGLAAQDTLANMIAGFTLLLDRPFHIGDRIVLATGEVGDVEAIGMRATRIRTLDETVLVVPNSLLIKERLTNRSRPTRHIACRVEVAVPYGSDLERAKRELEAAGRASPYIDSERPLSVLVSRLGEFAVHLALSFQARDYLEQGLALASVYEETYRRFAAAGLDVPYPVRRVIAERAQDPHEEPR